MTRARTGGCQCGAIRYGIKGQPLTLYLCHCRECQKQAAGAFGMSLWVRRSDFELRAGTPRFWLRGADSGGKMVCAFCGDCGSRVYHASSHESETISIKAGSLDDVLSLQPVGHIWTRSAQPWVPIDALPGALRYETEPAGFEDLIDSWTVQERGRRRDEE